MTRRSSTVVLWMLLLGSVGCGTSSPETGTAAAPAAAAQGAPPAVVSDWDLASVEIPDPCTLLSREEIVAAVGPRDFGPERQESAANGGRGCAYPVRMGGTLNIAIGAQSADSFRAVRGLLERETPKPTSVSGVGDEAYYWGERLYVRVGKRSLAIGAGSTGEENRAASLALAKAIVPKLR